MSATFRGRLRPTAAKWTIGAQIGVALVVDAVQDRRGDLGVAPAAEAGGRVWGQVGQILHRRAPPQSSPRRSSRTSSSHGTADTGSAEPGRRRPGPVAGVERASVEDQAPGIRVPVRARIRRPSAGIRLGDRPQTASERERRADQRRSSRTTRLEKLSHPHSRRSFEISRRRRSRLRRCTASATRAPAARLSPGRAPATTGPARGPAVAVPPARTEAATVARPAKAPSPRPRSRRPAARGHGSPPLRSPASA